VLEIAPSFNQAWWCFVHAGVFIPSIYAPLFHIGSQHHIHTPEYLLVSQHYSASSQRYYQLPQPTDFPLALENTLRQLSKLTAAMARLAIQTELAAMRAQLAAEEEAISLLMSRDPANEGLKRVWVDARARLRRELAEVSQMLVGARAETSALQGEIVELLNPPMTMLRRQVSDQRAQLATEMKDAVVLRARKQHLTELKREYEKGHEEWCRKVLQAMGQAE
jgi:hypothetical protein